MKTYFIAWWNVENLFDTSSSTQRPDWLKSKLRSELKGWTATVLDKKVKNLCSVIEAMNDGEGPDLLGVCEVENEPVLQRLVNSINLPGRDYAIAHHDTSDQRGIDVAFIYDRNSFTTDGLIFNQVIIKRNSTRDLVQINLKTVGGNDLVVIGNHWPSRLGGKSFSEPYRCLAGETLSYWIKRIQEVKGKKVPILVMGDFNDEPHDRSLSDYALATNSRTRVIYARNPMLYNLCWAEWGINSATYSYGGEHLMIDQMLVSKGLCYKQGNLRTSSEDLKVFRMDGMTAGRYDQPVRFGRPSSSLNTEGFSDHLPLTLRITEH
ncbi:MAG: putative extracellular nuclease [Flavobacteriales bacterium]|jgi:predicted extracellular nuclease